MCSFFFSALILLVLCAPWTCLSQTVVYSNWTDAHASFYYGINEAACNFKDQSDEYFPFEHYASVNNDWYYENEDINLYPCGQCYEVRCKSNYNNSNSNSCCKTSEPVTVQITNVCSGEEDNQLCSGSENHFNLQESAFEDIAYTTLSECELVSVNYRRVSCDISDRNITLTTQSGVSKWWYAFVVSNVAGYGDLSKVEILDSENSGGRGWVSGELKWYGAWEFEINDNKQPNGWRQPLDVRITDSYGNLIKTVGLINDIDSEEYTWDFGKNFEFFTLYEFFGQLDLALLFPPSNCSFDPNDTSSDTFDNGVSNLVDPIESILEWYLVEEIEDSYWQFDQSTDINLTIIDEMFDSQDCDGETGLFINLTITTKSDRVFEILDGYLIDSDTFESDILTILSDILSNNDENGTVTTLANNIDISDIISSNFNGLSLSLSSLTITDDTDNGGSNDDIGTTIRPKNKDPFEDRYYVVLSYIGIGFVVMFCATLVGRKCFKNRKQAAEMEGGGKIPSGKSSKDRSRKDRTQSETNLTEDGDGEDSHDRENHKSKESIRQSSYSSKDRKNRDGRDGRDGREGKGGHSSSSHRSSSNYKSSHGHDRHSHDRHGHSHERRRDENELAKFTNSSGGRSNSSGHSGHRNSSRPNHGSSGRSNSSQRSRSNSRSSSSHRSPRSPHSPHSLNNNDREHREHRDRGDGSKGSHDGRRSSHRSSQQRQSSHRNVEKRDDRRDERRDDRRDNNYSRQHESHRGSSHQSHHGQSRPHGSSRQSRQSHQSPNRHESGRNINPNADNSYNGEGYKDRSSNNHRSDHRQSRPSAHRQSGQHGQHGQHGQQHRESNGQKYSGHGSSEHRSGNRSSHRSSNRYQQEEPRIEYDGDRV